MSRKDRTTSQASLRAKCLIMSDLQIPHSRVGGKSDLHNYRPEKKNTNGPVLLSSSPLHSLILSISAAPSLAALFLSHFVTPRLSLSFPRQRLGELSPLIQMRGVACMKVWFFFSLSLFISVCARLPVHILCVCLLHGRRC